MRLNQVTVTMPDLDAGWNFYCALGLKPVVDARPHYARFLCPDGDSTFSLHQGESNGNGTTVYFECDDLDETVSQLQKIGLQFTSHRKIKVGSGGKPSCLIPAAIASCCILPGKIALTRHGVSNSLFWEDRPDYPSQEESIRDDTANFGENQTSGITSTD